MNIHSEKGQVLIMVMIAALVGGLLLPFFLGNVGTSLIGSRNYRNHMDHQYATDAGAEHAIWNLTYGGLRDLIPDEGNTYSYDLDEPINGENVSIIVTNALNVIAWDNFNTNNWIGGGGWLDTWATYGTPETTSSDSPKELPYHVRMNITDRITRSVDLSQALYANVRFWYKQTNNFDGGGNPDYAYLEVSNDGSTWQQVRRWSSSDNSFYSTYRYVTLSLTSYGLSDTFYIRFRADTDSGENFYIDDLDIVWMAAASDAIAEDDFESGDFTGGYGWLNNDPWTTTYSGRQTNASVVGDVSIWEWWWEDIYSPHGGEYQAQLRGNYNQTPRTYAGVISRGVDLTGQSVVHLQFWARQYDFSNSDRLYIDISTNGGSTWQNAIVALRESGGEAKYRITGSWKQFDIDLSGYSMTANFWIRFRTNWGNNTYDRYVWLDDIKINTSYAYFITAYTDERVLKVVVDMLLDVPKVLSWKYEE